MVIKNMVSKIIKGNKDLYIDSINEFKNFFSHFLMKFEKYLLVYHGDCDGIISAVLVNNVLKKNNKTVNFYGVAQFREPEYNEIIKLIDSETGVVFLEGYGMPDIYENLSLQSVNIDHHPLNDKIKTFINPRKYDILPNPANALLTYELVAHNLTADFKDYVYLASVMDYCFEASGNIKINFNEDSLLDLKNTFFAIQYDNNFTNYTVKLLSDYISFDDLLTDNFLKERKEKYISIFNDEFAKAKTNLLAEKSKVFVHYIEKSDFRISSSIANKLSDVSDNKIVVIAEKDENRSRLSIRNRSFDLNIGKFLNELCQTIPDSDATGHEKAASVRANNTDVDFILKKLLFFLDT